MQKNKAVFYLARICCSSLALSLRHILYLKRETEHSFQPSLQPQSLSFDPPNHFSCSFSFLLVCVFLVMEQPYFPPDPIPPFILIQIHFIESRHAVLNNILFYLILFRKYLSNILIVEQQTKYSFLWAHALVTGLLLPSSSGFFRMKIVYPSAFLSQLPTGLANIFQIYIKLHSAKLHIFWNTRYLSVKIQS